MDADASRDLIPTPQSVEPLGTAVRLGAGRPICIALGANPALQTALAAQYLQAGLEEHLPALAGRVALVERPAPGQVTLRLVEWPRGEAAGLLLDGRDEETLSPRHHGQSYVLRTLDERTVVLVGAPLGLLYGAQTLLQLVRAGEGGLTIPGVSIRDFPSFEHRAAADWLMNGEANRWSYDRGRGFEAYEAVCRRKLEFCLSYKINMVLFDGFGFGLAERSPEYPAAMRRLNRYARERGIRLVFGGYGAGYGMAYQPGPLYEDAPYLGTAWLNRTSYPDGPTYACLGYPRTREGLDPGVFGTCRSNEALNRLKAADLAAFVRAVEPGALYIHHEDFGGMDTTQRYWRDRCHRCRERWPNDEAAAADGAAGAIAHGYAALIEAVNGVRHPDTGYQAARDCLIILTSPVYMPSSPSPEGWGNALRFWQNVARSLPAAENLAVCFRETFPQRPDGARWVDAWNAAMAEVSGFGVQDSDTGIRPAPSAIRRPLGLWIYFAGGADHWLNDCPFVGTPALNALFLGAQGIYNACGDAYQEPQQVLNAEYSWNARSDGFFLEPRTYEEAEAVWRRLAGAEDRPPALFGPGGRLERICRRLYGRAAAPMVKHFTEFLPLAAPEAGETAAQAPDEHAQLAQVETRKTAYLPMAYDRVYGVPVHWRRLALDARTWTDTITNEIYARRFEACGISRAELHARLRRQWDLIRRQSERSLAHVTEALAAGPPRSSVPDLEFLREGLEVTRPLSEALIEFHEALRLRHSGSPDRAAMAEHLRRAGRLADEAAGLAADYFPQVSDPSGAEVGGLRTRLAALRAAIAQGLAECSTIGAAGDHRHPRGSSKGLTGGVGGL